MQQQNLEEECDYSFKSKSLIYKVALVGECDVGKTCIWQYIVKGTIPKKTAPTIGVEFDTKLITLPDGSRVLNDYRKLDRKDTVHQQASSDFILKQSHFRRAVGALVIFDITNKATFDKLKIWIETLKTQAENDIQILIVGNKLDLVQKNPDCRQVSEEEAKQLAKQYRCKYFEISAHTQENVTICFETLISELCKMKNGFRGGEQSQLKLMKQSANLNEGKCKC